MLHYTGGAELCCSTGTGWALPSLTVNSQEQREVGILALSPLSDDAVDSLQVLQTAGQLCLQLLGQAGSLGRQGLARQLHLPQALLQGQVLLDQVLILH